MSGNESASVGKKKQSSFSSSGLEKEKASSVASDPNSAPDIAMAAAKKASEVTAKKTEKKQEQKQAENRVKRAKTTANGAEAAKSCLVTLDTEGKSARAVVVAEGPSFRLLRRKGSFVLHARLGGVGGASSPPPRVAIYSSTSVVVTRGGGGGDKMSHSLVVCLPSAVDAAKVTASMSRGGGITVSMLLLAGGAGQKT